MPAPHLWLPTHLTQDPEKPLALADSGAPGRRQQAPGSHLSEELPSQVSHSRQNSLRLETGRAGALD